jgi:hypothetical protein
MFTDLPDEKRIDQLLNKVADKIHQWRLEVPAIFFLQTMKPLSFVGGQALFFFAPIAGVFFDEETIDDYGHILSDRDNVERLLTKLEVLDQRKEVKKHGRSNS